MATPEPQDELTRGVLRAELRAAVAETTLSFRKEMDKRFEPVNTHIARIERGEFTPAQQAAIIAVVDDRKDKTITRRAMRAPLIALVISVVALVSTVLLTLTTSGVLA